MASRVVGPDTTLLQISGGDWLLVRKRLNHGETQDMHARKYEATALGNRVNLNKIGLEKPIAYLIDWSLTDLDGQQIPIKGESIGAVEDALRSIDDESFQEIAAAIDAHEQAIAAERTTAKKSQDGRTGSPATSPSPEPVTGDMNGSAN